MAEEQAGVPLLLDFGAFSDLKNVDDLSIVTYLSVFHQRTLNKVKRGEKGDHYWILGLFFKSTWTL